MALFNYSVVGTTPTSGVSPSKARHGGKSTAPRIALEREGAGVAAPAGSDAFQPQVMDASGFASLIFAK